MSNVPLLERVKFLAIFSSNLDEFFMVRVARLKRQIREGIESIGPDGLTPAEALTAISRRVHELAEEQHLCFLNTILPQLTAEDIHLVRPEEMSREQERFLKEFFHRTLYPIVTPLAIDPGHPFPYLANRSLCLVVTLQASGVSRLPYAIFQLFIFQEKWCRGLSRFRRKKDNMHSCSWKMSCGIISRACITVSSCFRLRRSVLHGTRSSASRGGATRHC